MTILREGFVWKSGFLLYFIDLEEISKNNIGLYRFGPSFMRYLSIPKLSYIFNFTGIYALKGKIDFKKLSLIFFSSLKNVKM
ncbi:hypothetical protein BpHYR1_042446 [Brachionus plicatilis]|uniref:Uncharacterized protein n=1 Tax=Brachionus plicatilis TaxID=10195 RepID=A0A3M7QXF0_BRAPC|nr:hypothetical protein BpHYR1_042446 [Brachionus plicatilis]